MSHSRQSTTLRKALSRRHFLKATGVGLALPMLDVMRPAFASEAKPDTPRRVLSICNNLGLIPDKFFPHKGGKNYKPSPYLEMLSQHKNDFTVFSGVEHPGVDGGHPADNCFLTAAPHPGSGGFRNTISLDQYVAERQGHLTRFPTLTLGVNVKPGKRSLSWTRAGVMIPCENSAAAIFRRLFVQGSPTQIEQQIQRLSLGQSIMDSVADQTKSLKRNLGPRDKSRLDQYLTGVRDLEKRLAAARAWERKPKPKVDAQQPVDPSDPKEYFRRVQLMYDMAQLAFETDSTRQITLMLDSVSSPAITVQGAKITDGYHSLSHHGRNKKKLQQLEAIDRAHMSQLDRLYAGLKSKKEAGDTLLDRTMVLYGSNLGNASTHVTTNLPVLFAGGGFKHGQHLAFDRKHNYPLPNLFVSMLQRLGIETDRFSTATTTMRGLEFA